jgi:hypothetical protein
MKGQIMNIIVSQPMNVPLHLTAGYYIDNAVAKKITFNGDIQKWEPYNVPLIRLQFDIEDLLQVRNPRPMNIDAMQAVLTLQLVRSGIREVEHPTAAVPNSAARVRKSVSLSNGFRKHVISTFIEAGLNHEIRELIVDHATHLEWEFITRYG